MPARRSLDDWQPLDAERKLAQEMATGLIVQIGDGTLPPANLPETDPRVIRTSFLRALILGRIDGHPPHEKGVQVAGAFLLGDGPPEAETRGLDLEGCNLSCDLALIDCRIPDLLLMRSAGLRNLHLDGSHLDAGFSAQRMHVHGSLFLREIEAFGQVQLSGANVAGNLSFRNSRLTPEDRSRALVAKRLRARGNVDLRGLVTHGTVRLLGSKVGGSFSCIGAQLTAGAEGKALNGNRIQVAGAFFLRKGTRIDGVLDLTGARIGHFNDEPTCWPHRPGSLRLNDCRYGAFLGKSPVDAHSRISWLSLQDGSGCGEEFRPQPWEECARVLREMGHGAAAREILIEKEKRQRAARRARVAAALAGARQDREDAAPVAGVRPHSDRVIALSWQLLGLRVWDSILGAVVGYGRKPQNAAIWALGAFLVGWVVFANAGGHGEIKPNDPRILRAEEWVACAPGGALAAGHAHQVACFLAQPEARAYPRFNAFVYSADTLIPVVSLEMQSYWIPDDRKPRGRWARVYLWLHIAAGWALTLLAVAGFSGLIKTDNTR